MEENNIIVDTETLTLCRLCTVQKGKYHIGPNMIGQIKECFDIQIKNCDGLSQIVCSKCQIIVGEFHQAKTMFTQKQEALLERRRQLLLKESEESENITSTSIIRISSPPPPPPPVVSPRSTPPTKAHPLAPTAPKAPIAPDVVIDVDQVPSVSSSERASSPAVNNQTTCTKTAKPFTPAPTPTSIQPEIIPIANCPKLEPKIPEERYTFKFTCIFCAKKFMNKGQLRRHRLNFHPNLSRVTCALTTPCCIRMEKINLLKGPDGSQTGQSWVQLRPGHVTKYSPSEPYYFSSRVPITSDITSMDLSSSEDESGEPLAKVAKMTAIPEQKDSKTNNLLTYGLSDSDSRGSFDKASSVTAEDDVPTVEPAKETSLLQEVVRVEEDKGVENDTEEVKARTKPKPKPWMALHDKEFVSIIQSCWRLSQKKKALTAPVAKPWLMDTIKNNMAVEVVFVCSKITKVSMIKSIDMEPVKDPLTSLPSYTNRKKGDPASGHLRLKRVPLTLPRPDTATPPAPLRPPPPAYTVVKITDKGKSVPQNMSHGQSMPTIPTVEDTPSAPGPENKPLQRPAVTSQPEVSTPPAGVNPWSRPRLSSPAAVASATIPVPVTQISDVPVTNSPSFSAAPTSITPPGAADIIPIRNTEFFSPHEECDSFNPIIISTESLAPVAPESVSRPQIKCRPTSALLATPSPPPLQMAPSLPPPLPLLSPHNLFYNNGVLTHTGMSPFDLFTSKLSENNVFVVKQHIPDEDVNELVRFILTIREKDIAHNQYNAAHEYLVEVSGYMGNRILINIQDTLSNLVEVALWTNDFQYELIKSLYKPTFLETMRSVSLSARPQVTDCVRRFISTLTNTSGLWNVPVTNF